MLTCLAKEPARRYQTAEALASDLRAVLEARPIQVRRTPAIERLGQYLRQLARSAIRVATMAIVATLLALVAGFAGWRTYTEWRLGRIELKTTARRSRPRSSPNQATARWANHFEIVERLDLGAPSRGVSLRRLSAKGHRGRTYRFAVNRAESVTNPISLDDGRLLVGNFAAVGGTSERPGEQAIPLPLLLGTVGVMAAGWTSSSGPAPRCSSATD